jgi:DNA-binding Lrp family transcriptional regulator
MGYNITDRAVRHRIQRLENNNVVLGYSTILNPKLISEKVNRTVLLKPTEILTFSIEKDIIDDLRQESKRKEEDVDVLLNRLLRQHVTWEKPSKIGGNIPFSKGLLFRIFENISSEQMEKIAQDYVKYELKDQLSMLGRQYSLLSFMDVVCSWCEASGFPYRHARTKNVDVYTMRFDLGKKWSVFFGKFLRAIGEHFKTKDLELEVTQNTVVFKITESGLRNHK